MRFLVADDEVSIAKALKTTLEKNNHTVDMVFDGKTAYEYILSTEYDALILDIMMPEKDGVTLLKEIRNKGINVPAMFLSAKGEVEDRVEGLNIGADDYLTKPFAMSEFLARANALLRRRDSYNAPVFSFGNVKLSCANYIIAADDGEEKLSNKEFQLMELFMRNPRQVFSLNMIMDKIWAMETETEMEVIWTYIGYLRKKLKNIGANIVIKTNRGLGYSLEENSNA